MKGNRFDTITLGILAATALATLAFYTKLPSPMPTHFNGHGVPNGWMPRAVGAWVMPCVAFAVWALTRKLGGVLLRPMAAPEQDPTKPLSLAALLTTLLLVLMHFLMLRTALRAGTLPMSLSWVAIGVFVIALAQVFPRLRRNPLIGVRTPFSLASDENWARSQRFGSYSMTAGGVVAIVAGVAGATGLAVCALLVSALAPTVYSFALGRRVPPGT